MCIDDIGRLLFWETACRTTANGFLTTLEARYEPSDRGSWKLWFADHRCCGAFRPLSPIHRATEHRRSIRPRSGRLSGCVQASTPSQSARGGAQMRDVMPRFLSSQSKSILSRTRAVKGTRQLCRPDKNTGGVTDSPHDRLRRGAKEDSDRQARGRPAWPPTAGWQDVDKSVRYQRPNGWIHPADGPQQGEEAVGSVARPRVYSFCKTAPTVTQNSARRSTYFAKTPFPETHFPRSSHARILLRVFMWSTG